MIAVRKGRGARNTCSSESASGRCARGPGSVHLYHAVVARDDAELLDWVNRAPDAIWNHPTSDHLLPLFVVLGTSADSKAARQLHNSIGYGVLSMDAYEL